MNPRHNPHTVAQKISDRVMEGLLFYGMKLDMSDKMYELLHNELLFALEEVYQQGYKDGRVAQ